MDETITLLRIKTGYASAVAFGDTLQESRLIKTVHIDSEFEKKAWDIFKKYHDKSFSFTDCTSFVVMQQLGIDQAFSFDAHFKQFGYQILPSQ